MQLSTSRLVLRDFLVSDFDALRALEAHSDTYYFENANPSEETTRMQLEKMIEHQNISPRQYYRLAITIHTQDEVLGRISLVLSSEAAREWEIGWAIHPNGWGKGYATEAARCMMDFAFNELGAHRIIAISHASNMASVRVMEKLSMKIDGFLRETRWWHDAWHNELIYSILDREWKNN